MKIKDSGKEQAMDATTGAPLASANSGKCIDCDTETGNQTGTWPNYAALDQKGFEYVREARTVHELVGAPRGKALSAIAGCIEQAIGMNFQPGKTIQYGVSVYETFGLSPREAREHPQHALLTSLGCDLPLSLIDPSDVFTDRTEEISPHEYGKRAFHAGIPCAAMDAAFIKTMEGYKVGDGLVPLEQWNKGWDEAHLAAVNQAEKGGEANLSEPTRQELEEKALQECPTEWIYDLRSDISDVPEAVLKQIIAGTFIWDEDEE